MMLFLILSRVLWDQWVQKEVRYEPFHSVFQKYLWMTHHETFVNRETQAQQETLGSKEIRYVEL